MEMLLEEQYVPGNSRLERAKESCCEPSILAPTMPKSMSLLFQAGPQGTGGMENTKQANTKQSKLFKQLINGLRAGGGTNPWPHTIE